MNKTLAIVSAMDEEIEFLLQKVEIEEIKEINNFKFYLANLASKKLVISKSGIGKTAAGMLLSALNCNFKVDAIINTGICGGRLNYSNLGDVIVMNRAIYGDFDISPISNNSYGQVSGMPLAFESDPDLMKQATNAIVGDLLSTDKFQNSFKETEELVNKYFSSFNICGYDMESAAFAHAAKFFNIPFIAIRATSDVVGVSSSDDYNNNEVDLCKVSSEYLYNYLINLKF